MNFLDGNLANLILIASYSVLSFLFALVVTPLFYNFLTRNQIGKQIRDVGPDGKGTPLFSFLHKGKAGTPTMGGVVIWGTVIFMVLFSRLFSYAGWIDHSLLNRKETYLPIFVLVTVGILGMVDDWFNIKKIGGRKGMRVKPKLFWLTSLALIGAWWFYYKLGIDAIHIPGLEFFFPSIGVSDFSIGLWYIPLFLFIILATTNAVNLTDGLDGLAPGLLAIAFSGFAVIAFVKGMFLLTTLLGVVIGALVAFLWWNVYPAKIFMGDTGSLALGALLGTVALLLNSVLILPIIGFIFVIETLSVIIQLLSKKFRNGKKVFLIAPVHHHFEKIGWPEANVVMRFWIIGGMFGVVGTILGLIGMGIGV
jgi:phospho-N-acetylmuramoyl-pentapeptide-transferase